MKRGRTVWRELPEILVRVVRVKALLLALLFVGGSPEIEIGEPVIFRVKGAECLYQMSTQRFDCSGEARWTPVHREK